MMITEVPERSRAAARLTGTGLARFLRPWLSTKRKFSGRGQPGTAWEPERGQDGRARQLGIRARVAGSNAPLASLAGGNLAGRFHAWRGASGRRYICSVFPADNGAPDFGLPDFAGAIAIAVARGPDGRRRRVALLVSDATGDFEPRRAFIAAGLAKGAVEWHIHLLAEQTANRQAAACDIAACSCEEPSALLQDG